MKNKVAGLIAAIGGLCALCCVVPIAGLLGFGALEVFLCDSPAAFWGGIGFLAVGGGFLVYQFFFKKCEVALVGASCCVGCDCRSTAS